MLGAVIVYHFATTRAQDVDLLDGDAPIPAPPAECQARSFERECMTGVH